MSPPAKVHLASLRVSSHAFNHTSPSSSVPDLAYKPALTNTPSLQYHTTSITYKKAAKKVRPVSPSPPEDFRNIRRIHEDPLLTLPLPKSPPLSDQTIESTMGQPCHTTLHHFVGYDHQTLDDPTRDLTTVKSPIGALRLTCLPQGWTNAVTTVHNDVTSFLAPEIPHVARLFMDDCTIIGPPTRFETIDGSSHTSIPVSHVLDFDDLPELVKYLANDDSSSTGDSQDFNPQEM